jgi:hypothetical protein
MPFGQDLLAHLDAQLASTRRLLDAVLRQGAAIRAREVQAVVGVVAELQGEMDRRAHLDRERARLLHAAGGMLGVPAHAVTLEALTVLLTPIEAAAARERSAELRGLLAEVGREHHVNRALMKQEMAFLSHLLGMLGAKDDAGYAPPAGRITGRPSTGVAAYRALDLHA